MYSRRKYKSGHLGRMGMLKYLGFDVCPVVMLTWPHLAAALGEGDPTDASLPGSATLKK